MVDLEELDRVSLVDSRSDFLELEAGFGSELMILLQLSTEVPPPVELGAELHLPLPFSGLQTPSIS